MAGHKKKPAAPPAVADEAPETSPHFRPIRLTETGFHSAELLTGNEQVRPRPLGWRSKFWPTEFTPRAAMQFVHAARMGCRVASELESVSDGDESVMPYLNDGFALVAILQDAMGGGPPAPVRPAEIVRRRDADPWFDRLYEFFRSLTDDAHGDGQGKAKPKRRGRRSGEANCGLDEAPQVRRRRLPEHETHRQQ